MGEGSGLLRGPALGRLNPTRWGLIPGSATNLWLPDGLQQQTPSQKFSEKTPMLQPE